jgi:hypothetical protein
MKTGKAKQMAEIETRAKISELIDAGVADPATLVLLLAVQEILLKLDQVEKDIGQFSWLLMNNSMDLTTFIENQVIDVLRHGRTFVKWPPRGEMK